MKKAVSEGEFIGSGSIKKSPWIPNLYLYSSTDESSNHLNLVLASSSEAFTRYSLHLVCGTELPCRLFGPCWESEQNLFSTCSDVICVYMESASWNGAGRLGAHSHLGSRSGQKYYQWKRGFRFIMAAWSFVLEKPSSSRVCCFELWLGVRAMYYK